MSKKRTNVIQAGTTIFFLLFHLLFLRPGFSAPSSPFKALIVTGQNAPHDWEMSTPILERILEDTGLFEVDIIVSPPAGGDMSAFQPNFFSYGLVVLNYSGDPWPEEARKSFVEFVEDGGGVVVYHSANNAFPEWPEYNEIIGLGGWGNRNEKSGPYVFWEDGKIVQEMSPGVGGYHGKQHAFMVVNRDPIHPITAGLPQRWMHAKDELYSLLRGPALNLHVLATAYSAFEEDGSGRHEPVLFTVTYGLGRIFHTVLGHAGGEDPPPSLECAGFIVTFQRGAEWAATGQVTQPLPGDFPGVERETPAPADVRRWPGYRPPKLEKILEKMAAYDFGQDEEILWQLRDYVLSHRNEAESRKECEAGLIAFLEGDSTVAAKMSVCRHLRLIGSERSVPILEKMLAEVETADLARYALERIPGSAADEALLRALMRAQGETRRSLIVSLGERRAPKAVPELGRLLEAEDESIASAAAVSLGWIGDSNACRLLYEALAAARIERKSLIASSLIRCAESSLASKRMAEAAAIYERVLVEDLPEILQRAALRGRIITAGKDAGARIVLETLASGPEYLHEPAIAAIPGVFDDSTISSVIEIRENLPEKSRIQLLEVLVSYPREIVLPIFIEAAESEIEKIRITALKALAKVGDASTVRLLVERAAEAGGEEQEAARISLGSLAGGDVDSHILLELVRSADEDVRNELIRSIGERRNPAGKSLLIGQARSPSSRTRREAVKALREISRPEDLPDLLALLLAFKEEADREDLGNVIAAVAQEIPDPSARSGAVKTLLVEYGEEDEAEDKDVTKSPELDINSRCLLLKVLGKIGDDTALPIVREALAGPEEKIVDAAVRALADWPTPTPQDDVLAIAADSKDLVHHVLALQAYVRMVNLGIYRKPEAAVRSLEGALSLARRPEEKKVVLASLPNFACEEALRLAQTLLGDEELEEEARAAVDSIKEKLN